MPQHATPYPPAPTDFQTQLLTRLDEIIGLQETLTTTLADREDEDNANFLAGIDRRLHILCRFSFLFDGSDWVCPCRHVWVLAWMQLRRRGAGTAEACLEEEDM